MKIWCTLKRNPAHRCCESCALWSSFPVAYVSKMFMGKLLEIFPLDISYHSVTDKPFIPSDLEGKR